MLNNFNILIVSFIFIFVTPLKASTSYDSNFSEKVSASQPAQVIVDRAIIYSDENMSSPLGFVSKGKLVSVGNKRKKNPELLPIIVYGRLAFIEAKNIQLDSETFKSLSLNHGPPREHNVDLLMSKPEEKLLENNSIFFSLHQFYSGQETKNLTNSLDGSNKDNFVGFNMAIIHRQSNEKYFWGAEYEFSRLSSSNLKFSTYMIGPVWGFTPLKNPLFKLDLTLSMDFSISSEIDINNNYSDKTNGFIWGPQVGARMLFLPYLKYHTFASFGYRSYRVLEMKNFSDNSGANLDGITKINGISLSLGIALDI